MSQYAMNYIVSNANVTTQEVEETEETTTAAEQADIYKNKY